MQKFGFLTMLLVIMTACTTIIEGRIANMTDEDATEQITGQCHCGNIKYKANKPIVKCSYCDCGGCQKASGTLKSPFVTVKRQGFILLAGKPTSFEAKSGIKCDSHGVWNFCPKCGTQIFWKGHKGDEIDIFAGTLDDTTLFKIKE